MAMTRRSASVQRRRRWLWSGAAALLTLVAAAVIATIIVAGDEEALRARFQDMASEALGMEVRIDGPVDRGLWPVPHVRAGQLRVGEADSPLVEIESVEARLAIVQLFAGRLRARSVAMAGVEIRVARDAKLHAGHGHAPGAEPAGEQLCDRQTGLDGLDRGDR